MENKENNGVSLFSRSEFLIDNDPMEEIFALNLGDFISEHLISTDLAEKIGSNVKDKKAGLINQLKELISIYSIQNTLCVLNFETQEDYAIYKAIAVSIAQMVDVKGCSIYVKKEFAKGLQDVGSEMVLAGASDENASNGEFIQIPIRTTALDIGYIKIQTNSLADEFTQLVESIANLFANSITSSSMSIPFVVRVKRKFLLWIFSWVLA